MILYEICLCPLNIIISSLVVQWLRLQASNAEGVGSISGWETKILHAVWHSQKKKSNMIMSRSIHVAANSILFCGWVIFHCRYIYNGIYVYICIHTHTHHIFSIYLSVFYVKVSEDSIGPASRRHSLLLLVFFPLCWLIFQKMGEYWSTLRRILCSNIMNSVYWLPFSFKQWSKYRK